VTTTLGGVKELLDDIRRWRDEGEDVVVATVVGTRRSAPRPVGSSFAVSGSGALCGSVSGGCVESAIVHEAEEVFETGRPKLLTYGITYDEGWNVGLPCGGEIDVFVEKVD
jgi:xanthine/CO dehydrogenase XdhC/CoxF family maturation factor